MLKKPRSFLTSSKKLWSAGGLVNSWLPSQSLGNMSSRLEDGESLCSDTKPGKSLRKSQIKGGPVSDHAL